MIASPVVNCSRKYGRAVISDPFPDAGGFAVGVKTKKDESVRVVQIPATVLQSVMGRNAASALGRRNLP
jgi:hypothetical protein